MAVHICTPYRIDKNLGKAYNDAFDRIGDDDWNCFIDIDATFLTSDAGVILDGYAAKYPDTALFVCRTNRVSTLSKAQLHEGKISENADMRHHIDIARKYKDRLYKASQITVDISGVLMMVSKRSWKKFKFTETGKCLMVDTEYSRRLRRHGKKILLMEGLYIFHIYRMINGIFDKRHLL